jgi:hypothetical protein
MSQDEMESPDGKKQQPATLSPEKLAKQQRSAEALRANLRRRKAQVRGRKAEPSGSSDA